MKSGNGRGLNQSLAPGNIIAAGSVGEREATSVILSFAGYVLESWPGKGLSRELKKQVGNSMKNRCRRGRCLINFLLLACNRYREEDNE